GGKGGEVGGEGVGVVDEGVVGLFQLQNLATDVDGDLLGQIAAGNGGRPLGDVAHLRREVARHEVHVVREVLPGARHAGNGGLAAQLARGTHVAGGARDRRGEGVELLANA